MRDSARKQRSHFPIDLYCQPSQNGAQLYSGCDVSVITGLIKIFLLKVNWSIIRYSAFQVACRLE